MDGIPIREAAQRLGVSVAAYKVDGEWFIAPPKEPDTKQDTGQDDGQPPDRATAALVDQLSFMQREMERRDLEIERLTGMLAESQRTVRLLLPATAGQAQDSGVSVESSNRNDEDDSPLKNPSVAPGGAQREIGASQVVARRPWWARLLGFE